MVAHKSRPSPETLNKAADRGTTLITHGMCLAKDLNPCAGFALSRYEPWAATLKLVGLYALLHPIRVSL